MRVEEYVRRTVVFVGVENRGQFIPMGTGCLGAVRIDDVDIAFLITADHVVDDIRSDNISIRLNRKNGGCETFMIPKGLRLRHPDHKNDIALFGIGISPEIYDFSVIPLDRTEFIEGAEKFPAGPGDEVPIVGLYTSHYGHVKNIPIVRIGHIAALPDEPVMTHTGYVVAYLIETKSIAGLSGSPVYLNVPRVRVQDGKLQYLDTPFFLFLGILIGYHIVESREDQIPVPRFQLELGAMPSSADQSSDERNTGFSVVIPFERVLEIVENEKIAEQMRELVRENREAANYRPADPTLE